MNTQTNFLSKFIAIVLLFIIALPTFSFATTTNSDLSQCSLNDVDSILDKYTIINTDGSFYFDLESAKKDNNPEYIYEIGDLLNQLSNESKLSVRTRALKLPIYGNWCGPGHSGPADPIDKLDERCQFHDQCYAIEGYFSCTCDLILINDIKYYWYSFSISQKTVASAIKKYFEIQRNLNNC